MTAVLVEPTAIPRVETAETVEMAAKQGLHSARAVMVETAEAAEPPTLGRPETAAMEVPGRAEAREERPVRMLPR